MFARKQFQASCRTPVLYNGDKDSRQRTVLFHLFAQGTAPRIVYLPISRATFGAVYIGSAFQRLQAHLSCTTRKEQGSLSKVTATGSLANAQPSDR